MGHSLFRLKPIVAAEDRPPEHRLARNLSWPHLVALGVGAIVGTGIYTLIGVGAGPRRAGGDPVLRRSRARSAPARRSPMPKWRR